MTVKDPFETKEKLMKEYERAQKLYWSEKGKEKIFYEGVIYGMESVLKEVFYISDREFRAIETQMRIIAQGEKKREVKE